MAIIQHEYGIFGGRDGADVLEVLAEVRVPVISVLHTVLTGPTPHQRHVLAGVVAASSVVVTMTHTARQRLLDGWDVDPGVVLVIAHGAEDNRAPEPGPRRRDAAGRTRAAPATASPAADIAGADIARAHPAPADPAARRPTILTWGLIGPGKGIEWAIDAMVGLRDLQPRYLVMGRSHPKVVDERDGEAYRDGLAPNVPGTQTYTDIVELDDRYLGVGELAELVRQADVVSLPDDSRAAGDLRGAHRGGRGRAAGGVHGLPARDRVVGRRHRDPRAAAGPRGAGGGSSSGAQRTRAGRGSGRAGGAQGARPVVGDGGRPLPRDRDDRGVQHGGGL